MSMKGKGRRSPGDRPAKVRNPDRPNGKAWKKHPKKLRAKKG